MNIKDIKRTYNHPLNRKRKLKSIVNYFRLGAYMRLNKNKMFIHPYIHDTKLLVGRKSASSMGQYFNSLNDFDEMSLLLHFLDKNDIFVDVGANVGVFSVLASGVSGAKSIAIEPNDENIEILKQNIAINNLQNNINIVKCVVGEQIGEISFTKGLDSINRVTREEDTSLETELIKEETLDNLLKNNRPSFIKIDVEGFELNVLNGAKNILQEPNLKILIIETNGLSSKYQLDENEIFNILENFGFSIYRYSPFERNLNKADKKNKQENSIFIRNKDIDEVITKIKNTQKLHINGISY
ncbi:MAG: FkbM family methyltransferase [Bacteroidales bacterium]|nr:FkbM family methyltransferase [Bacteroidales bacterium]MBN2818575.1 FkbM family methyltransferase [Bacteroidales bacterium]